jgi:hypothetical protein
MLVYFLLSFSSKKGVALVGSPNPLRGSLLVLASKCCNYLRVVIWTICHICSLMHPLGCSFSVKSDLYRAAMSLRNIGSFLSTKQCKETHLTLGCS